MDNWVLLAIVAYLFNAVNGVVDKFMLSKTVRHPVVYAFYTGVTSLFVLLLIPFGVHIPSGLGIFFSLVGGAAFSVALYFLYSAIQATSISRVLPIEGGFIPMFTLVLAYFVLGERLTEYQYIAFVFLVFGAVLISLKKDEARGEFHPQALASSLLAAVFFSISFVFTKFVYNDSGFLTGLVWSRFGMGLMALAFLIPKANRQHVFSTGEKASSGSKLLFYGSKVTGGVGGLMENYAISIGSVTLVKAMQGTQYVFLLLLTSFLTIYFPRILKEKITLAILIQKLIAIGFITIGLILLTK